MKPTVLFVCSNQNHARMFTPVARRLIQREGIAVVWVALDSYYRHNAEAALLENGWSDFKHLPRPPEAQGTPWEGGARARVQVLLQGRKAVRALVHDAGPGAIVLGNDMGPLERLFIREGQARGIPSLLVQEGVIALHQGAGTPRPPAHRRLAQTVMTALGLRLPDPKPYGQNGADRIAVMGPAMARWLQSQGVAREQIAVTGLPAHDRLYALKQGETQPESLAALEVPETDKIVLFSSQPYLRYNMCGAAATLQIWQTVIEGVRALGAGHHLVAKLHPAEDLDFTRRWVGEDFPPEWTLVRDADVLGLIFRSDALVTVSSTTALEAIYLGKPTVILECGLGALPIPYVESGAALLAKDAAELTVRLRQGLYDAEVQGKLLSAREAFVSEQMHSMDGRAAERVAGEILALIR